MSKLKTDTIDPRLASNVDFGGIDPPSFHGQSLVLPNSPVFTGDPTAPTQADSDNSTRLATTAFAKTRADNAAALEVTNRLATAAPTMDGNTAAVGASTKAAREDHVHPHDANIAALGVTLQTSLGNSFFLNTPGTYSNIFTVPATGTLFYIIVGGGGGGGGGGADSSGIAGNQAQAIGGSITVGGGQVITAVVGAGGAGAPAGSNPLAVPSATGGQTSTVSVTSGPTLSALGGTAGPTIATGSVGGAFTSYVYFCIDTGDFATVRVAQPGLAAGTPSSGGGNRALTGVGTSIFINGLAGDPTLLNGQPGRVGGGGGGGAPSKAFVGSRGFYIDPVDGEGGDGIPTAAGGRGGNGLVYLEYQASTEPRAVTVGVLQLLKAELLSLGFVLSFHPTLS